jgi:hypothetical protein
MTLKEGDTVPVGWYVKDWDAEVPVLVTEAAVVIGTTTDRPNPVTGVREMFRTLSVQKSVVVVVVVPVVTVPPQAASAMAEIIAAGGKAEFAPALTHARASHCRQWEVSGTVDGHSIDFRAFSTGPHRWICAAGSRPTMGDTLALMPAHIIAQAEVEAKSKAHKAYVAALGAAAPTDTSHWNNLDWQSQVERDNDRSW